MPYFSKHRKSKTVIVDPWICWQLAQFRCVPPPSQSVSSPCPWSCSVRSWTGKFHFGKFFCPIGFWLAFPFLHFYEGSCLYARMYIHLTSGKTTKNMKHTATNTTQATAHLQENAAVNPSSCRKGYLNIHFWSPFLFFCSNFISIWLACSHTHHHFNWTQLRISCVSRNRPTFQRVALMLHFISHYSLQGPTSRSSHSQHQDDDVDSPVEGKILLTASNASRKFTMPHSIATLFRR